MVKLFSRNACRAKNPAFCRYHGVPAPASLEELKTKEVTLAKQLNRELKSSNPNPDIITKYRYAQYNTALKIIAIESPQIIEDEELNESLREYYSVDPKYAATKNWVAARKEEETKYFTALREEMFKTQEEQTIAEHGLVSLAVHDLAIEKGYPVVRFTPLHDGRLRRNEWKHFEVYASDEELDDYNAAKEFAEKNKLDLIIGSDNEYIMGAVVAPFSWKDYGISQTTYNKLMDDPKFTAQFNSYNYACQLVREGKPVTGLAGGRKERKRK